METTYRQPNKIDSHPRDYFRSDNTKPRIEGLRTLQEAGFTSDELVNYVCLETGLPFYDLTQIHPTNDVMAFLQEISSYHPLGPIDTLPWLPLLMLGPIPVVGHFHPYAQDYYGLHRDLVFNVIISADHYTQVAKELASRWKGERTIATGGAISTVSGHGTSSALTLMEWLRVNHWCPSPYKLASSADNALRENPHASWILDMLLHGRRVLPYNTVSLTEHNLSALPQAMMEKHQMICYARRGDIYYVASSNPAVTRTRISGELNARIATQTHTKLEVICSMAHPSFIEGAIHFVTSGGLAMGAITSVIGGDLAQQSDIFKIEYDPAFNRPLEEGMEAIDMVRWTLFRAVNMKASDIHIQEEEESGEIRFRINGALVLVATTSLEYTRKMLSIIKLTANLNVAEKRMPQDGRFTLEIKGDAVDARVSTVPVTSTNAGESCVIRLINKKSSIKSISELDLPPKQMGILRSALDKKSGLILVTGPTGSGKTSTLYACLSDVNRVDVSIVTIEDPVEIVLHRAKQLQVNPAINLTFARLLRSVLRHDPDIIMVGEIRDQETADHAIQAAQTGHLVFATLHTNDALRSIPRLEALGTDRHQLANSLIMVQAQRLVRSLCPNCRKSRKLTTFEHDVILRHLPMPLNSTGQKAALSAAMSEWKELIDNAVNGVTPVYDPGGCITCNQTGYVKRKAVMEVFPVDNEMRDMIETGSKVSAISQYVLKQGHSDLALESLRTFIHGDTSYDEIKGYMKF